MQGTFFINNIKKITLDSFYSNKLITFYNSKIEGKKFIPQIIFNNNFDDKAETSTDEIVNDDNKSDLLGNKKERPKSKYVKKNKKTRFRVANSNYSKSGNYLAKNSKRHQNCKNKIIRNFIQDVLIYWVNDGIKNKILKKINPANIPYDFIEKKELKLKDIYKEIFETKENVLINNEIQDITQIKLNFSLRQAFISFYNENSRSDILKEINGGEIEDKNIFAKLKTKNDYIKEKQLDIRDKQIFEDCFKDIADSL